MTALRNTAGIVAAVVLVIALAIGAWFGYWALTRENTEQRYKVNTGTQQYQSGLIAQQRDRALAYDQTANPDQQAAIAAQFCQIALTLSQPPADLTQAAARICN